LAVEKLDLEAVEDSGLGVEELYLQAVENLAEELDLEGARAARNRISSARAGARARGKRSQVWLEGSGARYGARDSGGRRTPRAGWRELEHGRGGGLEQRRRRRSAAGGRRAAKAEAGEGRPAARKTRVFDFTVQGSDWRRLETVGGFL
jgi:hypothetical protein